MHRTKSKMRGDRLPNSRQVAAFVIIVLAILGAVVSSESSSAQKLKAEDIVARHLESIGIG